jgi:CRP-like cAMP-binding protein
MDGGTRSASVIAETPIRLDVDRREFGRLLDVAPSVVRKMLDTLAGRLREADVVIGRFATQ